MKIEEKYETYAYFWVSDFECESSEISKALKLLPSEVHLKGEPLSNNRVRKRSFWELHSTLPRTEIYQDEHISNLIDVLMPRKKEIVNLHLKYSLGINCVGYYTKVNPGFNFSAELIKSCAQLGIGVDFDLYCG